MFQCFLLFLLHSHFQNANADIIGLSQVAFDGPNRGPVQDEKGGPQARLIGVGSEKAKPYYAENINIVQEDVAMRWPLGIVPYFFDLSSYDYLMNNRVREAMDIVEAASCVHFTPTLSRPDNHSWINFTNPEKIRECVHTPTYKRHEVVVTLGLDCLSRRELVHTLLHAIGFQDEVTHPQRDLYIRVIWENIQPRYKTLFRRQPDEGPSKTLVEYDPLSVMHFHDRAFSRNGYATIAGLLPGLQIAPSENLSQLDKMKLRLLFGHECNRRSVDDIVDSCKREFQSDQLDGKKLKGDKARGFFGTDEPTDDNDGDYEPKPNKLIILDPESMRPENNTGDEIRAQMKKLSATAAPAKDLEDDDDNDDPQRLSQGDGSDNGTEGKEGQTEDQADQNGPTETSDGSNMDFQVDDRIGTISERKSVPNVRIFRQ